MCGYIFLNFGGIRVELFRWVHISRIVKLVT